MISICVALHVSAWCGHVEMSDMLVSQGAVVNASDYQRGLTPLHLAAQTGHQAVIVRLSVCLSVGLFVCLSTTPNRRGH